MPNHRLTIAQVDVLLAACRHDGPVSLATLGLAQGSGTLGSLWKHGLVQRLPGTPTTYVVTEEGHAEAEQYRPRRNPEPVMVNVPYNSDLSYNEDNARITLALESIANHLQLMQLSMREYLDS